MPQMILDRWGKIPKIGTQITDRIVMQPFFMEIETIKYILQDEINVIV